MENGIFVKRSRINAPVSDVFKWHARPGALERLSPPWDPIQVIRRTGGILPGAEVYLKMKLGPFSYPWHARHSDYDEDRLFRDQQVKGPFRSWIHTHRFEPDGERACFMEDHIEYRLPAHSLSHVFAKSIIQKKLTRIFNYRHRTLMDDLVAHGANLPDKPMTILISGASGVIGSALVPFLTTGGHRVIRLVRRKPAEDRDELFWDPLKGELNLGHLDRIDAVIHLSGEHIGKGRWTSEKKRIIVESRTKSTRLISQAISNLEKPPRVFLCASAIGFYGDRGDECLAEAECTGDDFISSVCHQWEVATGPAQAKGIRTALLRFGVVLTPLGGTLERLLLPYKLGLGGKIGTGDQYISWIGMDDSIAAMHHALVHESIEGPVNVVAPEPVTHAQFTKILGGVLSRPTIFTIPSIAVKAAFGQMGNEVLLASCRVVPEKLTATGYSFRTPTLQETLKHALGLTK